MAPSHTVMAIIKPNPKIQINKEKSRVIHSVILQDNQDKKKTLKAAIEKRELYLQETHIRMMADFSPAVCSTEGSE